MVLNKRKTRAVTAFLLLAACASSARFRSQAEAEGFVGPVHTVLTHTFAHDEDQSAHPSAPNSLVTFDPEGFRTEEIQYDADGAVLEKTTMSRDGWNLLEEYAEYPDSAKNRHIVQNYDQCRRVAETREYDSSGSLRRKVVYDRSQPHLVEEKTYDGNGTPQGLGLTFVDHERRVRIVRRYQKDGLLRSNWRGTWDKEKRWIETSVYYPKGALSPGAAEHRTSQRFRYQGKKMLEEVTHDSGGQRSTQTTTRDLDGRILREESLVEAGEHSVHWVTENDARQQPLQSAAYDKRGLQQKTVSRYEYDARGNWIKKTDSLWTRESDQWKVQFVTERQITYY